MRTLKKMNMDQLAQVMPVISETNQKEFVGGTGVIPTGDVTGVIPTGDVTGNLGDCVFKSMSYILGGEPNSYADSYGQYVDDNNGSVINFGSPEDARAWVNEEGVAPNDMSDFAESYGFTENGDAGAGSIIVTAGHCVVWESTDEDGTIHYIDPQNNNAPGFYPPGTAYTMYSQTYP